MARKLSDQEFMSAAYGTRLIMASEGVVTGDFDGFVIAEDDSVVSRVLHDDNNLNSELGVGTGRAFKQTNVVRHAKLMTSITVETGVVNAIKAKP